MAVDRYRDKTHDVNRDLEVDGKIDTPHHIDVGDPPLQVGVNGRHTQWSLGDSDRK